MILKRLGLAAVALASFSALSHAAGAPPRTVEDILAVLDGYKPDPEATGKARAALQAQPPAGADASALAVFYVRRALAAQRLGTVSQQIRDLHLALEQAQAARLDISPILESLRSAELAGGHALSAIELTRKMLTIGTRGRMVSANASAESVYRYFGDLPALEASYGTALGSFGIVTRNTGDYALYGGSWEYNIALAKAERAMATGHYAAAEADYRDAVGWIEKFRPMNNRLVASDIFGGRFPEQLDADEDWAQSGLGEALLRQGKLAEAEVAGREALRRTLERAGRASAYTGVAIAELSDIIAGEGRYREAGLLARAALQSFADAGALPESAGVVRARRALARSLAAQRLWREADLEYSKTKEALARDPAASSAGEDTLWALALVRLGRAQEALPMMRAIAARDRRNLGDDSYGAAVSRGFLALTLAGVGERTAALAEFRAAVPVLLAQARADRGWESGEGARAFQLNEILESYLGLLGELATRGESPGFDAAAEAFRIADAARASSVQRSLAASAARASLPDPELAALARDEQDAQRRIRVLSDTLERLLAAPPGQELPEVVKRMKKDLAETRTRQAQLAEQIKNRFPGYADLVDPQPATLAEASERLDEHEALVAMYVTDSRTLVWAVRRGAPAAFASAPLGRRELAERVTRLRRALDVGEASLEGFPAFDTALAHELYAALLEPVEAGWKDASSLLVVPDGALGQLPFAVLVTSAVAPKDGPVLFDGYRDVPWLIKRVALTQLPSVGSLITLRKQRRAPAAPRSFAGFGDPLFSRQQVAEAPVQRRGVARRNLAIATIRSGASGVANSSTLAQLAPLPDTALEIREIAAALHADPQRDVFLESAASESNAKAAGLADRRIVAFATHGLVPGDLDGLTQPALALSAPEVTGHKDEDGLLAMDEILGLRLNADWVVLSACNTASGDGAGTEAVSGLGRAFFYAGTRALLVSNWAVETVSARLLTTDLFRRQAEDPRLTRAEALRRTMLALMEKTAQGDPVSYSYAHPMFWAPFTLVGDGGK